MKLLHALLALFISQQAIACPDIYGTWQSSKELSMDYNNKLIGATQPQTELLEQILGILKLTYADTSIHDHGAPTLKVTVNGKQYDFVFEDLEYKYEILSCTETSIKIRPHYPYGGSMTRTLNFINRNIYWVSPEHLPKTREYFVRVSEKRT
ncbi:MAG: hypothetical protein K2Y28_12770 [Burkholderiaceae bacterium]|nr:hypothetical protein [Burkholderiaceae bacterium]